MTSKSVKDVLVVDDDDAVRSSLRDLFQGEGYDVITARHGREAFELLAEFGAPRVILLDLMMPVMDGWQFLTRQREDPVLRHVPVVILTARSRPPLRNVTGAASVAGKPIDSDALLEIIRQYCPSHASEHSNGKDIV